jgi:hypothetical protein
MSSCPNILSTHTPKYASFLHRVRFLDCTAIQRDGHDAQRRDVYCLRHPQEGTESRADARRHARHLRQDLIEHTDDKEQRAVVREHEQVEGGDRAEFHVEQLIPSGVDGVPRGLAPQQRPAQRAYRRGAVRPDRGREGVVRRLDVRPPPGLQREGPRVLHRRIVQIGHFDPGHPSQLPVQPRAVRAGVVRVDREHHRFDRSGGEGRRRRTDVGEEVRRQDGDEASVIAKERRPREDLAGLLDPRHRRWRADESIGLALVGSHLDRGGSNGHTRGSRLSGDVGGFLRTIWYSMIILCNDTYRRDRGLRRTTSRQISFEFLFIKTPPPVKLQYGFRRAIE